MGRCVSGSIVTDGAPLVVIVTPRPFVIAPWLVLIASRLIVVAPRLIVVTSRLIIVASRQIIIAPRLIVVAPRLIFATSRRSLRGRADIRFKHRAAPRRKLWRVLPQARDDPIDVRYLFAAKSPNIRGAGHLLFHRPPILLRDRNIRSGAAAADRYGKGDNNSTRPHVRSFCCFNWRAASARQLLHPNLDK